MTHGSPHDDARMLPVPARLARRPRDARGYVVPWFAAEVEPGRLDIRVADERRRVRAVREQRCWLCGERLGKYLAFVIGPMCAVNRVSSEPPSHRECAEYAVRVCPFLTRPHARRNPYNLPAEAGSSGGIAIARNPGVSLVWVTTSYTTFRTAADPRTGTAAGWLISVGDAVAIRAYAEGGPATREEVDHSMETGYPLLRATAEAEGPEAVLALATLYGERKAALHARLVAPEVSP